MYRQRSSTLLSLLAALVLSAGLTLLLHWAGSSAMTIALFILLILFFFYAIAIARAMLTARRYRARPFGRGGGGQGEWSGVREPRRPRPPNWPPRAEAVVPETSEEQPASDAIGQSDPHHSQPLRSKDDVA
jgi:membrane-associated protease RseP (regulator of RpoE activity)